MTRDTSALLWSRLLAAALAALALSAAAQPAEPDSRRIKPGWALQQATPDGDSVVLDGRVRARNGERLSGTGQSKFVIYRRDGSGAERQVWNSARGRVSGLVVEPDASVNVPVRAGRFSIRLGDSVATPPLPELEDTRIALPTPWVRIWWREPDGVFRVLGPDLPIDAAPLAREAALAGDADRLAGRDPEHYLSRLNHVGPEPHVDYVQTFHLDPRNTPTTGCKDTTVKLKVDVPADGVLVVQGHATIGGVLRAGGKSCDEQKAVEVRVCPPTPGTAGSPATPGMPAAPTQNLPAPSNTPSPPAVTLPQFRGEETRPRDLPPLPCIEGDLSLPRAIATGTRSDTMAGRTALALYRTDLPGQRWQQVISRDSLELVPDVLVARRMGVSSTFAVQKGTVTLEMEGRNGTDGGFSEHNLTAMFFPTRRNSSQITP